MPKFVIPEIPAAGPGSAIHGSASKKRGSSRKQRVQHKKGSLVPTCKSRYIGQDLFDSISDTHTPTSSLNASSNSKLKSPSPQADSPESQKSVRKDVYSRSSPRLSLAVDARCLETSESVHDQMLENVEYFIKTLSIRGAPPSTLAVTRATSAACTDSNVEVKCFSSEQMQLEDCLRPVRIQSPPSSSAHQGIAIPKLLSADQSWKLMGSFVNAIMQETDYDDERSHEIMVVTTDVALCCEWSTEDHKPAIKNFWDAIIPFFESAKIASIKIIVTKTGICGLAPPTNASIGIDGEVSTTESKNRYSEVFTKCVVGIDRLFGELVENDLKVYSRTQNSRGNPVRVAFSCMDNTTVDFLHLSRCWLRDAITDHRSRRIQFELPETMEGTQCNIGMDASYFTFPFAINTPEADSLMNDLVVLSECKFEVKYLVPLDSLDASLVYGVPITVHPGFDHDMARFKEMKAVVKLLFRFLQDRGVCLLLRTVPTTQTNPLRCLFQSKKAPQTFILMAQETPKSFNPNSGVLMRYSDCMQFLSETTALTLCDSLPENDPLVQVFAECIDDALDALECKPVNPLCEDFDLMKRSSRHEQAAPCTPPSDSPRGSQIIPETSENKPFDETSESRFVDDDSGNEFFFYE